LPKFFNYKVLMPENGGWGGIPTTVCLYFRLFVGQPKNQYNALFPIDYFQHVFYGVLERS